MLGTAKTLVKHGVIRWLIRREEYARRSQPLVPKLWGCGQNDEGFLTVEGVSVGELADRYGTPLHILHEQKLLSTHNQFLNSFKAIYPRVILATSYKTNPVPYVLKTLHAAGTHAEVISHFELWLALKLGVPGEKIILNGPGKGDDALRLAVERQVRMINIDGPGEIIKIADIARELGVQQHVGLRVTTSVGWSSQFGLSIASGAAESAFRRILDFPELIPVGLHLHLGTGIQSIETYTRAVQELIEFADHLKTRHGVEIDFFDLGGGFGVPTVRGKTEWDTRMISLGYPSRQALPGAVPDPADFARALIPQFEQLEKLGSSSGAAPTVVLEPGRAITSSAQMLLLSVIGKKSGPNGKQYLIVDGGKNITMPLEWETHQVFAASRLGCDSSIPQDVFGPLCHPGDIIIKNQAFPELEEGDLLAIMDAGAYFIPNQMNFSNPRPPIVCVRDDGCTVVRRRETFEDIVQKDVF